jgi:hypothetical protein
MLFFLCSCQKEDGVVQELMPNEKDYWYDGYAEVTTFFLDQARYGQQYSGTVTLIYVTEDFSPKGQTK